MNATGSVDLDAVNRDDRVTIPALDFDGHVMAVLGSLFDGDAVGVVVLDDSRRVRLALDADRDEIRVEEWVHGTYRDPLVCEGLERRDGRVVVPVREPEGLGYNGRRIGVSGA